MSTPVIRLRWAARRDGIAHAHATSRSVRTLCGEPEIRERDAWPAIRRCIGCTAIAAELVGVA